MIKLRQQNIFNLKLEIYYLYLDENNNNNVSKFILNITLLLNIYLILCNIITLIILHRISVL